VRSIRIKGLVREANRVRQKLTGPISAERLEALRRKVEKSICTVDAILAEGGSQIAALPTPSRKAYAFLAGIDFAAIKPSESTRENQHEVSSIRLSGLKGIVEGLQTELASGEQGNLDFFYGKIRDISRQIEDDLVSNGIEGVHLTEESRGLRGWLAYFSVRKHFDTYTAALRLARRAFEQAVKHLESMHPIVLIHFRPVKGLYRIRWIQNVARVSLPTPMISFDAEEFAVLAELATVGSREKQRLIEKTHGEVYQSILVELERLEGIVESAAGVTHDLATSFARVNEAYFDGRMVRPRLTWSRTFTDRKFGHYDSVHDTVLVSVSLDDARVPEYVVDFLVYHELLHKKLGTHWNNGRRHAHTPEFRREEREFKRFSEAEAVLNKLASTS